MTIKTNIWASVDAFRDLTLLLPYKILNASHEF